MMMLLTNNYIIQNEDKKFGYNWDFHTRKMKNNGIRIRIYTTRKKPIL